MTIPLIARGTTVIVAADGLNLAVSLVRSQVPPLPVYQAIGGREAIRLAGEHSPGVVMPNSRMDDLDRLESLPADLERLPVRRSDLHHQPSRVMWGLAGHPRQKHGKMDGRTTKPTAGDRNDPLASPPRPPTAFCGANSPCKAGLSPDIRRKMAIDPQGRPPTPADSDVDSRESWREIVTGIGVGLAVCGFGFLLFRPADHVQHRGVQAIKTATELRTAMMNYYSEYKRFPPLAPGPGVEDHFGDTKVETSGEPGLIAALLAVPGDRVAEKLNRRGISFLSAPAAKQKGQAGVWKEGGSWELCDPWGNPYWILFDSNLDNTIHPPSKADGFTAQPITADVAVWSYGPNHKPGPWGRGNDDIYAY